MEGEPLVTVVVPCYNCCQRISVLVEAVLANDYRDFELLLLEGGSTDASARRIRELAERDARIRAITDVAAGLTAKRNLALKEAKSELLIFIDDDRLPSSTLIGAYARASMTWSSMMTGGSYQVGPYAPFPDKGGVRPRVWKPSFLNKVVPSRSGIGGNFAVPKALARKIGGWDERIFLVEDFDFALRVLLSGHGILFVPEATVVHPSEPSFESCTQRHYHAGKGLVLLMRKKYRKTAHGWCAIAAHIVYPLYALFRDFTFLRWVKLPWRWAMLRGALGGLLIPLSAFGPAMASPRAGQRAIARRPLQDTDRDSEGHGHGG